jgi:transposase InsO family protein
MKLTKTKILETIRHKNDGWTTYQVRKIAGISIRRVNQVWVEYLKTGEIPEIGKRNGRPKRPILQREVNAVKEAYSKYRVSASTLEKLIKRDYELHIPHNHIHKVMIKLKLAGSKDKKDIRKKNWIRYERKHSLTAVHLDWFYNSDVRLWALPVIDDASRKLLALEEVKSATTEASIQGMINAMQYGKIKQCITDHGTQFIKSDGDSRFHDFLKKHNIKHILCRIKHPQSNGKSEKFNHTHKEHRSAFETKEEFMRWYNEIKPHRSLRFDVLETPEQAFIRKMRKL